MLANFFATMRNLMPKSPWSIFAAQAAFALIAGLTFYAL
jgi:hypothetical protein